LQDQQRNVVALPGIAVGERERERKREREIERER
jgi:hypothetical protein